MPSWIGPWEIIIVLVIVLLIFGPRKLPELGSSLGKSIRGFRKGMKDGEDEPDQASPEVKETAVAVDSPLVRSEAAAAAAVTAPDVSDPPKCWGTWEDGNESCLQCAIASDCAVAAPARAETE